VPSIRIVEPGLQTSVQDRGRFGWEALGIPRGGAIDYYAYAWANRLARNPPDSAVLQALLLGPTLVAPNGCWLATTGADAVTVDGRQYPGWAGFWVPAGSVVSVKKVTGARAYIAVGGGIAVEPVLGSRSTDLESGFGGYEGRASRAGDTLPIGGSGRASYVWGQSLQHPDPPRLKSPLRVRVVAGPRDDEFPATAAEVFYGNQFRVSSQSNHMGIRLDGITIPAPPRGSRISEPMPVGGIQVTPSGQAIVLLNARGTIGGYPLLATAITPDIWRLGQVRPGDLVRFQAVTVAEAQAAMRQEMGKLADADPITRLLR
jgi:antagonist of KipI